MRPTMLPSELCDRWWWRARTGVGIEPQKERVRKPCPPGFRKPPREKGKTRWERRSPFRVGKTRPKFPARGPPPGKIPKVPRGGGHRVEIFGGAFPHQ